MSGGIRLDRTIQAMSPIGLRLVDLVTGQPPSERVRAELDLKRSDGSWRRAPALPQRSPGGVWSMPNLELHRDPVGIPDRTYRVRFLLGNSIPEYMEKRDGFEFDAPATSDMVPAGAEQPADHFLYPASNYPFPDRAELIRGRVVGPDGLPVRWARVEEDAKKFQTLADAGGEFALLIRSPKPADAPEQWTLDAHDFRAGRTGDVTLTMPDDMNHYQTIQVS